MQWCEVVSEPGLAVSLKFWLAVSPCQRFYRLSWARIEFVAHDALPVYVSRTTRKPVVCLNRRIPTGSEPISIIWSKLPYSILLPHASRSYQVLSIGMRPRGATKVHHYPVSWGQRLSSLPKPLRIHHVHAAPHPFINKLLDISNVMCRIDDHPDNFSHNVPPLL